MSDNAGPMRTLAALAAISVGLAGCSAAEPQGPEAGPVVVTVVVPPSAPPGSAAPTRAVSARTSPSLTESSVTNLRAMVTEPCDTSAPGIQKLELDLDNDGVPEIVERREGGRAICRRIDYTKDGRPDETRFFDPDGNVRRLERDTDGDGVVDQIIMRAGAPPACTLMVDSDRDGMADTVSRVDYPKP